jgi:hypothetical protein
VRRQADEVHPRLGRGDRDLADRPHDIATTDVHGQIASEPTARIDGRIHSGDRGIVTRSRTRRGRGARDDQEQDKGPHRR